MAKIKTTIKIEDEDTIIQESFEVPEYEMAKQVYPQKLNICMRMLAARNRKATSQLELSLDDEIELEEKRISQQEMCISCQFEEANSCKLRGELPDQTQEASCIYYVELFTEGEKHEDLGKLEDMLKAQIQKKNEIMDTPRFKFVKKLCVTTQKARECFVESLNEELRGILETIDLIFDTEINCYLYDERFLKEVLVSRKMDETDEYINNSISIQDHIIQELFSKIKDIEKAEKKNSKGEIYKKEPEERQQIINTEGKEKELEILIPAKKRNNKKAKKEEIDEHSENEDLINLDVKI